jgi:uncharacterized membrane protein YqiK
MNAGLISILIVAVVAIVLLGLIFLIFARMYQRASKEVSYVRTGMGGQRVIRDGGSLVLPILHNLTPVNMNTVKLRVTRAGKQALITKDFMRVDVDTEFYVRVAPSDEAISNAAQTLGIKTMRADDLKELIEGKFVDALRSVASSMDMVELHQQRAVFVQKTQNVVSEDIAKNGLELESVSLTGLDQTSSKELDPNNAFDAQGLAASARVTSSKLKERNDIEKDTEVQIEQKNLDTALQTQAIRSKREIVQLDTDRQIAERSALQEAELAAFRSEQRAAAQKASIEADRLIRENEIVRDQAIALAEQQRDIAVSEQSQRQSQARAAAEEARGQAVKAEQDVETVKQVAVASRAKDIALVEAEQSAQQKAIGIRVNAEAERDAAENRAKAVLTEAQARSEAQSLEARGRQALAEAEAAGQKAINAAANSLSETAVTLRQRLALIEALPGILRESNKPLENIDSLKIVQLSGGQQVPGLSGTEGQGGSAGTDLASQIVNATQRYRVFAPLVDGLMSEVGLNPGQPNHLIDGLAQANAPVAHAPASPSEAND